jgi:carboxymethylenebutenolidase
MSETRVEVAVDGGTLDGRLILPDGEGPWPLVVFYMDAGGLREAMSTMGARFASAGYAVVQPNLYWRSGPYEPFDCKTVFGDEAERARLMVLLRAVRADQAMADTKAIIDEVAKDPRIRTDQIGFVGYCMGGRMAFVAATELGERVAAAASIHGGGLVSDEEDSPHRGASRIRAPLYLGVADQDRSCTAEHQATLREALDAASVQYQLELYDGCSHGFAVPDFPVYDEAGAERHYARVLSLFESALS